MKKYFQVLTHHWALNLLAAIALAFLGVICYFRNQYDIYLLTRPGLCPADGSCFIYYGFIPFKPGD